MSGLQKRRVQMAEEVLISIQTRATKKLRDNVFESIMEMHLDYFNHQQVGTLMNHVYHDVQNVRNSISTTCIKLVQNLRFYDVDEGGITVDGSIDVRELDIQAKEHVAVYGEILLKMYLNLFFRVDGA